MIFIELDQFLVQPLTIVLELRLQGQHFRLNDLHLLHGLVALVLQRHEHQLDQHGQENDRDPVVVRKFVEESQHIENRLGHRLDQPPTPKYKPAEIDRIFQPDV